MRVLSTKQILAGTILLLKKGWSRKAWARNAAGNRCQPTSIAAVCWCPEGAMRKICTDKEGYFHDDVQYEAWVAFHDATGIDKYDSAAAWNDQQTSVEPVIKALKKAMASL